MVLRFLQLVPAFRILISYIFGLVLLTGNIKAEISLIILSIWSGLFYSFFSKKMATNWSIRWMPCFSFICIWTAIGAFSGGSAWSKSEMPLLDSNNLNAIVRLESEPIQKKRSYQIQVKVINASEKKWNRKKIVLYIQNDDSVHLLIYGDLIQISTKPQLPVATIGSTEFDYPRWLRIKGICATAYVKTGYWRSITSSSGLNLKAIASGIASVLVAIFRDSGLKGNELALASAMSFGYRSELDREVETHFRSAGIIHIISVSGLHVAVIYSILQALLMFLRFSERQKKIRMILIIILLWGFAFITGLTPSVNRSVMMFSLISVGSCLEKRSQTLNTVLFSAFILLLCNPLYLYDIGFQLSYCAVIGIVIAYSKIRDLWEPKIWFIKYLRDLLIISIVAQLSTVPLTVHYFGQFPNYFLLGNLIAVPLSSILIFLSISSLIFHFLPLINVALSWCLNLCASIFLDFAETMDKLPFAVTENIKINFFQVVVLYTLLFSIYSWLILKRKKFFLVVLICAFCFQLSIIKGRIVRQIEVESCEMLSNQYLCKKQIHAHKDN